MSSPIRVLGTLVGDIQHKPDMQIKYGRFFESLSRRFELVEVYDATLHGRAKYWNALRTFTPSLPQWKQRFFKNVPAFQARSWRARKHFHAMQDGADVVLQLGALFDATSEESSLPVVLYTDNTTSITARYPDTGRLPFKNSELGRWLDCEMQLYHRAVHICARASIVKRSLIDDYGVPAEKVSVIGGGVNLNVLPVVPERKTGLTPTLLFIGIDFYRKGGDLVLQAFGQVRKLIPSAQLIVVTQDAVPKGFSRDGVRILAPIWGRAEVQELYRQADVFILPSRLETWGDVLLEAMAFGLPCIGVYGQAMEDIIIPGETGFLVAPEQIELLTEAIVQLFEQPNLRYRMGQAASLLVAHEFTWDRVVERLAPILDSTVRKLPVSRRLSSLERMCV